MKTDCFVYSERRSFLVLLVTWYIFQADGIYEFASCAACNQAHDATSRKAYKLIERIVLSSLNIAHFYPTI